MSRQSKPWDEVLRNDIESKGTDIQAAHNRMHLYTSMTVWHGKLPSYDKGRFHVNIEPAF